MKLHSCAILTLVMHAAICAGAAQAITWTSFDYPGAEATFATGIDGGVIVGSYQFNSGPGNPTYGFTYDGVEFHSFEYPDAFNTTPTGISGNRIIGTHFDPWSGSSGSFVYDGTTFTDLAYPGAQYTFANGIDGNAIVGSYVNETGRHGFTYDGVNWHTIDHPAGLWGTEITAVEGIHLAGHYWIDSSVNSHGFAQLGGPLVNVDPPDSFYTIVTGLSGARVVGNYFQIETNSFLPFIYAGGSHTSMSYPGSLTTSYGGIDGNQLVGSYRADAISHSQAFIAELSALTGDYNQDGVVDAADYTRWRDTGGTPDQFAAWKQHFGTTSPGLAAGSTEAGYPLGASADPLSALVPEPSALTLLLLGALAAAPRYRGVANNRC